MPLPPPDFQGLARIREHRLRKPRDLTLSTMMRAELVGLRKQRKAMAGIAAEFERIVGPALAEQTRLAGVRAGVLTVEVPDSAARYLLDQTLRARGLGRLGVNRVKVVAKPAGHVGPPQDR